MIGLNFKISPDPIVIAKKLKLVAEEVTNLKPVWTASRPRMGIMMQGIFSSRGRAIGETWPGLTKKYQKWKARKGGGGLLVLSGKLQRSITGALAGRSKNRATYIVSRLIYAPPITWGWPAEGIPKRRLAGWAPSMEDHVMTNFVAHVERILKSISD